MMPFLAVALIFIAVGAVGCYGYVSSREQEARDSIREGKRRLHEAAKAAEALAASRAELEALREQTYAKAAEAQAALEQAEAQVAVAEQTLRVVQAVREQTVQIMSKRWDEAADEAEPTAEPETVAAEPVVDVPEPKAREQLAARQRPKVRKPVTVRAVPEAPAQLVEVN